MGVYSYVSDGLKNLVANIGTPRDKASRNQYVLPALNEYEAVNAYRGAWMPRKIIDIPALDACRNWRSWNAESIEIGDIEAEEARLGVQKKVMQAQIKARLFGGAAIYIGTGQNNPMDPLNPESIKKGGVKHLNVITKRVLQAGQLETDPESSLYGKPSYYTMTSSNGQVDIHPSRLVIFNGAEHPDPEMSTDSNHGWGDSVLLAVMDSIKRADGTAASIASLVFEAKVDVIKIPDLMKKLAGDKKFESEVLNRLTLAATAKGINGTLILDDKEDYQQKSASFSGLTDILLAALQIVSGAADIPITRFLGQAPGGLQSTGDADIRNYYDRIKAGQDLEMRPAMALLDECLIRSALGDRPDDVFYTWRSLWQSTEKERADIGKTTAETIKIISETKLIPEDALSKTAVNMLTESGVAPGLESDMADFEPGDADDEDEGATEVVAGDAKPRTLYVRRDVLNKDEIKAWAKEQGIEDIADDLHVTITYSRQPLDWIKAGNANEWIQEGDGNWTIPEGGPRAVEPLGGMSAVILFSSSQLCWRHEDIIRAGASHDYPEFTPHISLTKSPVDLESVEPYRGKIVLGPEIFEELDED